MPGFGHDFHAVGVDHAAIQRGVLNHLARLGARAGVPLLLLDPLDIYKDHFAGLRPEQKANLHRVGSDVWNREVSEPAEKLPPDLARVPHDGHFGPGTNALIAKLVHDQLITLGVASNASRRARP